MNIYPNPKRNHSLLVEGAPGISPTWYAHQPYFFDYISVSVYTA